MNLVISDLVSGLKEAADETAAVVRERPIDTIEGQAAALIEEWRETLQMVADGCAEPAEAARQALLYGKTTSQ